MSESSTFLTLNRELNRLKEEFIPEISPTGSYSESQLSKTAAYRVFAHAEIEYYLEESAWEVVQYAKIVWDTTGKTTRTLICLLGFSGLTMDEPPDTLTPKKGSQKVKDEKIKINKKIDLALESFRRVIHQNHGVKEANILALLLPIGIDSDDLDPAWLATMNTFGENRGKVAHKSATSYRTFQPPDPATELKTVEQIIQGLSNIDELINKLMQ